MEREQWRLDWTGTVNGNTKDNPSGCNLHFEFF